MLEDRPRRRTDALVDEDVTAWSAVPEGVLMDTPSNRSGHHAHRLELAEPTWGDLEAALARWLERHGGHGIGRALLLYEAEGLELEPPALEGDFEVRRLTCMRLVGVAPIDSPERGEVRALTLAEVEGPWRALHERVNPDAAGYGAWAAATMRSRVERGRATQWGVFVDRSLVCVGATVRCDGETRFQEVMTDPEHRRRGYASALVAHAAREASREGEVWIVADRGSRAEALYARLGFEKVTTSVELGAPPPRTEAQLRTMVAALEAATLPKAQWRHREHLAAATMMLRDAEGCVQPALERLRRALRGYLAAIGTETTADAGYHETLTRAWLELVAAELGQRDEQPLERAALGIELRFADAGELLRHYTKERLMSAEARRRWLPPDLEPLPAGR